MKSLMRIINLEAAPQSRDQAITAIAEFLRSHTSELRAPGITTTFYPVYSVSLVSK